MTPVRIQSVQRRLLVKWIAERWALPITNSNQPAHLLDSAPVRSLRGRSVAARGNTTSSGPWEPAELLNSWNQLRSKAIPAGCPIKQILSPNKDDVQFFPEMSRNQM